MRILGISHEEAVPKPPKHIVIPRNVFDDWYHQCSLRHLELTVQELEQYGVTWERGPGPIDRLGFLWPIEIDGRKALIDICDHCNYEPVAGYEMTFKKSCLDIHEMGKCAGWVMPYALSKKAMARMLSGPSDSHPAAKVCAMFFPAEKPNPDDRPTRTHRRLLVRSLLVSAFGSQVETKIRPEDEHHDCIERSLVTVHTGGAFPGSFDCTAQKAFALGRCVVCPTIENIVGEARPHDGVHYVSCNLEYSDLVSKVRMLLDRPMVATQIGNRARQFFLRHMQPKSVWGWMAQRMRDL